MYTVTHIDHHGVTRKLLLTEVEYQNCLHRAQENPQDLDLPVEQVPVENPAADKRYLWKANICCVLEYYDEREPDISGTTTEHWWSKHNDEGDAWEEYLEESQLYKLPWKEGKEPDFSSPDISYEGWEIENAEIVRTETRLTAKPTEGDDASF